MGFLLFRVSAFNWGKLLLIRGIQGHRTSRSFPLLSSLTDTLARHLPVEAVPGRAGQEPGLGRTTSLRQALSRVPDPRHRRGVRYPFLDLLHIIVCAVI